MSDAEVNLLVKEFEFLWSKQGNFRMLWNTAAQYVMPAWDNFIGEFAEGVNRNTRIFDSTGIVANERFAAAMESILTPASSIWHRLRSQDETLDDNPEVQRWLEEVNRILFAARYHPQANFASQMDECYMSLGAFGNNFLYVDELKGECLRYRSWPLSELVWALNHQGFVDTVYRRFKFTAKQAYDQWGEERLPQSVRNTYAQNPFEEADYLHVIKPNAAHEPFAMGAKGMRFTGWYIHLGSKQILQRGGYRAFPGAVGRYRVAPRETYGRGPATTCLPDIRTANEMVKTAMRGGQKAVDPPILLSEESVLSNFNQRPGANNYGMVTADGKPLAIPFKSEANWELGKDQLTDVRGVIKDTFLNTLFQILVENVRQGEPMTATEVMIRAQEKGELLAPAMGRQQAEFLGPLIRRELDILSNANQLPPAPAILLRSGKGIRVEYTSPMARALKAEEATAIMSSVQDLGVMAQIDPTVRAIMDLHESFRLVAEIRGTPAKLVRTEDEMDQILEQQQQQQAEAQTVQALPAVSQSALNIAKAGQALSPAGGGASATTPAGQ